MHLSSQVQEQTIVVQRTNDGDRNLAIIARLGMSSFFFGRPHVRSCEFSKAKAKSRGRVQLATETRYGTLLSRNSQETVSALPANPGWHPNKNRSGPKSFSLPPNLTDVLHGLSRTKKVALTGYPLWTGAARRDKKRERMREACRCLISQRFVPRNSVGTPSIFSWCRAL